MMSKHQPDLNIRSAMFKKGISCREEGKAHPPTCLPTYLPVVTSQDSERDGTRPQCLPWPPGTESVNQWWPTNSQDEHLTALRGVPWVVNNLNCLICPHSEKKSRHLSQACQNSLCPHIMSITSCFGWKAGMQAGLKNCAAMLPKGKWTWQAKGSARARMKATNPFRHPGVAQITKCPALS